MGQRLDVLIDLSGNGSYPIVAQVEGKRAHTGSSSQRPAHLRHASPRRPAKMRRLLISRLNVPRSGHPPGSACARRDAPRDPRRRHGAVCLVAEWRILAQRNPADDRHGPARGNRDAKPHMMPHPMHFHGHAFQVVAVNGAPLAGAVRDTVLVPPMGSVTIAFDADNPGRWAFHCHNLSSRQAHGGELLESAPQPFQLALAP
jgi:FtsP/CotA-like multicopper oxidase with cupredoxin domain